MPELVTCPQCQRPLRVAEENLGKKVKCPSCGNVFAAARAAPAASPSPPPVKPPPPSPPPVKAAEGPAPVEPAPDEGGEFNFGAAPPRPRRRAREDEEEDEDEEPEDEGLRPMRGARPHRGGTILALGIISLVLACCPLVGWICGGIAISMAGTDLPQIAMGKMDRGGKGLTRAGQICGTIAVVISTLVAIANVIRFLNR